jgi:SAM-dependent methyltransferase
MTGKTHWEKVYTSNAPTAVSWYQPEAHLSLELIKKAEPRRDAPIIDIGGGASTLVDGLLDAGYRDVTVLDIAPTALSIAQRRLGDRANLVHWLATDILTANLPHARYMVWHDRAVFHFLTDENDRKRYDEQTLHAVEPGGHVIVASFAPEGPERCSGLDVVRYSPESMHAQFGSAFTLVESVKEEHHTPGGRTQAFVYCLCRLEQ